MLKHKVKYATRKRPKIEVHKFEVKAGVYLIIISNLEYKRRRLEQDGYGGDDKSESIYFGDDKDIIVEVKFPEKGLIFGSMAKSNYYGILIRGLK